VCCGASDRVDLMSFFSTRFGGFGFDASGSRAERFFFLFSSFLLARPLAALTHRVDAYTRLDSGCAWSFRAGVGAELVHYLVRRASRVKFFPFFFSFFLLRFHSATKFPKTHEARGSARAGQSPFNDHAQAQNRAGTRRPRGVLLPSLFFSPVCEKRVW